MASDFDEILLTSFALGELTGTEREAAAACVARSERARRYVAEIQATASLLSEGLSHENWGGLTDLQHAAIEDQLDSRMRLPAAKPRVRHAGRRDALIFAMSLAASVLIVCGIIYVLIPYVNGQLQLAAAPKSATPTPSNLDASNSGSPAASPTTRPSDVQMAHRGQNNDASDGWWTPLPDDRLAAGGSGHEETSRHPSAVVAQSSAGQSAGDPSAADPSSSPAAVSQDGTGVGSAKASPRTAVAVNRTPAPDKKSKVFLWLPPDQQAPDKDHPGSVSRSVATARPVDESYPHLLENPFVDTAKEPISGFAAGVDTASYSNIRRFITHGSLPPKDAVRIEEMLNYFPVRPLPSQGDEPLTMQVEVGACPWRPDHRLARVCVQAMDIPADARPSVNLVFVVDVSDSMRSEKSKLPLLKQAMRLLVGKLGPRDRVSIVAYTREAGVVMPPTAVDEKQTIWAAIDRLDSGDVVGGQGIEVAYDLAARSFIRGGVNRIILATDGGWSVGRTDRAKLASVVAEKSRGGVSLTVIGVGMNNLNDAMLQKVAEAGAGSYAYVDTLDEARKVLSDQVNGALVPVARDVKVQVAFNPDAAQSYRLIGYERRALSREELNSQSKHGGELGAGQSVTALYQVIPAKRPSATDASDLLTATVTYVDPNRQIPRSIQSVGQDHGFALPQTSYEFRFAAAVAEFGLLLHDSDYKGNATYSSVLDHTLEAAGPDETGYRQEFVGLVRKAKSLSSNQ